MRAWLMLTMLWISGSFAGEITDLNEDDVSKYWAEDFKALGHLYGKTSDKDLYGASLPPPIIFNVERSKVNGHVLKKTEHFEPSDSKQTQKFSESAQNYPNTQSTNKNKDPQTYNYLRYLEQRGKQKAEYPDVDGFTPYFGNKNDGGGDYVNTQSLLNHSTNKAKEAEDMVAEGNTYHGTNKARSKVRFLKGNGLDIRSNCREGICRNKVKNTKRFYSRPVKKIKKIVYNY